MLFCVFMLLSLYVATAHSQDFVCGYGLAGDEVTATYREEIASYRSSSSTDPIYVLPLFGKFKDSIDPMDLNSLKDRDGNFNESVTNLLDSGHKGSLAHFFNEMSYGALSLTIPERDRTVVETWLESKQMTLDPYFGKMPGTTATSADCGPKLRGWRNALRAFAREVIEAADTSINFDNYDSDKDGRLTLAVAVFNPVEFSLLCGPNGTVFDLSYVTNDHINGDTSQAKTQLDARVITGDHSNSFPYLVGLMAHEYGHAIGLPELYDRTNRFESNTDYDNHSAGIGYYGVMGKGNNGYAVRREGVVDGPAPLSEWSRIDLGWIEDSPTATDDRLDLVPGDMDLSIHDINSDNGKVYKILVPGKTSEYFLLSNRQNTYDGTESSVGSYYDEYAPASGLLIYHVDEDVDPSNLPNTLFTTLPSRANPYGSVDINAYEERKFVDVECADGLWLNAGPGATAITPTANSERGGDNLDYWTGSNSTWKENRRGNIGDRGDVWTTGEFTPYTNPSTDGYNGMGTADYKDDEQTEFTGIAMREISQANGVVSVDIRFIPDTPEDFSATVSRDQVDLSWSAPDPNRAVITGYEYSDGSLDSGGNEIWTLLTSDHNLTDDGAGTFTAMIGDLTGRIYTFKVRAFTENEKGLASASASVDLLFQRIEGTAKVSVPESVDVSGMATGPVDVGVYTNTAPNSNQPVWSLIGADASTFSLVQTSSNSANERTLQFKEPPNYEVPLVGDGYKTTYDIGVVVKDVPLSRAVGTNGAALADTLLVTVEVTNVEEAGSVGLSPLPPRVGVPLVARLTDPDEGLTFTGASWVWQRRADDAAAWQPVSTGAAGARANYPELSSYVPKASDVGYHLRATVDYTDNHGPNKRAESEPTAVVVAANSPPEITTDTEEATHVSVEENSTDVYTYMATDPDGDTITWELGGADAGDFTLTGGVLAFVNPPNYEDSADADTNNEYAVDVIASDGSLSSTLMVRVTVSDMDEPPTFAEDSPASVDMNENTTVVHTYTADDPDEGHTITWSLTSLGTDHEALELVGSAANQRTLQFKDDAQPNYEVKSSYSLTLQVQSAPDEGGEGVQSASLAVAVAIRNAEDTGSLVLQGLVNAPVVGTALVAQLTDEDGHISLVMDGWQWQRKLPDALNWQNVSEPVGGTRDTPPTLHSYTPTDADLGHLLRATVSYTDGYGDDTATLTSDETTAWLPVRTARRR